MGVLNPRFYPQTYVQISTLIPIRLGKIETLYVLHLLGLPMISSGNYNFISLEHKQRSKFYLIIRILARNVIIIYEEIKKNKLLNREITPYLRTDKK